MIQMMFFRNPLLKLGKEWVKVSTYYTTDKNYRYLYIGQFRPDGETGPRSTGGYVLVDDVQIRKLSITDQFGTEVFKNNKAENKKTNAIRCNTPGIRSVLKSKSGIKFNNNPNKNKIALLFIILKITSF